MKYKLKKVLAVLFLIIIIGDGTSHFSVLVLWSL